MVQEHRGDYPSEWAAITSIAEKLGVGTEALRLWLRRAEIDQHQRPGVTTAERDRIRELERENRELRRANDILKAASACFARELDPRLPKP
jgi:transposase